MDDDKLRRVKLVKIACMRLRQIYNIGIVPKGNLFNLNIL